MESTIPPDAAPEDAPDANGRALIESERAFRLLVESVTDYAIFMLSPRGQVESWNSGAERIKGYTAAEIVGHHFRRFYTEEDRAAGVPDVGLAAARRDGKFEAEGWRVRKDGSRFWASVAINAIHDEGGALVGFAKVTRDLTERRNAQEALYRTREQLFQAQKLESIGQLTGGVAHDFNNLLAAMMSGLSLIERRTGGDPQFVKLMNSMRQAIDRGRGLTQQLLTYARRQPLNPELIHVGKRMGQTFTLLERLLSGNIRVTTNLPPNLWPINVDPNQLDLAILNVCLNARDAMPEGGTLAIAGRNVPAGSGNGMSGDAVAISISDTGVGIPPEHLGRVFEPFFTTKEVGKGSGLGLSQAYGFATESGGTIDIRSVVGVGTTVTLRLPAAAVPRREAAPSGVAESDAGFHRGNILVVEDELSLADLTGAVLEDAGFSVTVAHSANAALSILMRGTPIDAVFSDIVMPGGMNGVELAGAIRKDYPRLPVVLTTGYSEAAGRASKEAFEIVQKPYDPDKLSALLAHLIAESRAAT